MVDTLARIILFPIALGFAALHMIVRFLGWGG